jgi:hypothetical protein
MDTKKGYSRCAHQNVWYAPWCTPRWLGEHHSVHTPAHVVCGMMHPKGAQISDVQSQHGLVWIYSPHRFEINHNLVKGAMQHFLPQISLVCPQPCTKIHHQSQNTSVLFNPHLMWKFYSTSVTSGCKPLMHTIKYVAHHLAHQLYTLQEGLVVLVTTPHSNVGQAQPM